MDQHPDLDEMLRDSRKRGIHVVVTNLKFEQWLLWHVNDRTRAHTSNDLDRLMKSEGLMKGKKAG
ncbi:RloB domain-containing protein [Acidipropionibacterium virtanenii]|uniref:RloB domain-containing protein n=1 Tax=Acidipropionibacterium virtanenii TaxID=2057246 RepID=UPI003CCC4907